MIQVVVLVAIGLVSCVAAMELNPRVEKVWLKPYGWRINYITDLPPWRRNYRLILSIGPREYRWIV